MYYVYLNHVVSVNDKTEKYTTLTRWLESREDIKEKSTFGYRYL